MQGFGATEMLAQLSVPGKQLNGVWALGLVLPRLTKVNPLVRYFPFVNVRRPKAIGVSHFKAYNRADMVWAEPQFFNSRIVEQKSSVWKPLSENLQTRQKEGATANTKSDESRRAIDKTDMKATQNPSTSSISLLYSTVFMLSERRQFLHKKQPFVIDLSQSRFSAFPKAGCSPSAVIGLGKSDKVTTDDVSKPYVVKNSDQKKGSRLAETINSTDKPQSWSESMNRNFPEKIHLSLQHMPHLIPLVTILNKVVEETIEQKMQNLVDNETIKKYEHDYHRDTMGEPNLSQQSEQQAFQHHVLSDENVRSLMSRLQALAAEDRFRMGLGR